MSAVLSSVLTYSSLILPVSTHSLMKWCQISICFVRSCWIGFLASFRADWLSIRISCAVLVGCNSQISLNNLCSQIASLHASVLAIYSASVEDSATVGCFLDFHVMAALTSIKTYPVVDLRVEISLP